MVSEILDGDRLGPRIHPARRAQVVERRGLHAGQDAAGDRGAGQGRHKGFRHRLDVGRPFEPRPAEGFGDDHLAVAGDCDRMQLVKPRSPRARLGEAVLRQNSARAR